MYQNEDGGFGHALEADCWNPLSSPIQTWAATQIIREIGLRDKKHPIILGILDYLEKTEYFNGHAWNNTVPSNNDFPHALWWEYVETDEINYNPTVSLIGFIFLFADAKSTIYHTAEKLLSEAYEWFKNNCPLESMHTASCFAELFEDLYECNYCNIDLNEFEKLLHLQIANILTTDTSIWSKEYVCKPSLFIHSRSSRFYMENKKLCDFERQFISQTQMEDGTWNVTWNWDDYQEQWHISKNWWKSDLIIKNVKFFRNMQ